MAVLLNGYRNKNAPQHPVGFYRGTIREFVSPLVATVLAVRGLRAVWNIGYDDFSLPLRGAELGSRTRINDRDDIPEAAAAGAAVAGILRNLARNFMHEHAKQYFSDPINVVKLS